MCQYVALTLVAYSVRVVKVVFTLNVKFQGVPLFKRHFAVEKNYASYTASPQEKLIAIPNISDTEMLMSYYECSPTSDLYSVRSGS